MKRLGSISVGGGAADATDKGTPVCGPRQDGDAGVGAAAVLKDGGMEREIFCFGAMAGEDQRDVGGHEGGMKETDHI